MQVTGRPVRRATGERGVAAIVFALMLTALLTMSAIAIDLGAGYAERRHDQNTADVAAMSGAVQAVLGGGVVDDVVAEVRAKVDTTLDKTVTDAEWTACKDPAHLELTTIALAPANPTIDPVTECISFNLGFDRVRVKLPPQEAIGAFGPALGFGNITTSAAAVAQVEASNGAGAPPFIAFENAKKGDFVCLRTGGAENAEPENLMQGNGPGNAPSVSTALDPCHSANYGVSSSTFGTVKPYAYKSGCTSPGNTEIRRAIAIGMDHLLGVFPGGFDTAADTAPGAVVNDGYDSRQRVDGWDGCKAAYPNTLQVDTGFTANLLRCALLSPSNSDICVNDVPRLKQGAGHPSGYTITNETFDNTPLWTFFRRAKALHDEGAPVSCVVAATAAQDTGGGVEDVDFFNLAKTTRAGHYKTQFLDLYPNWRKPNWDPYDLFDWTDRCLDEWQVGTNLDGTPKDPELFTEAIGDYPRFAFIPQVAEASLSGPGQLVHIEGFLPVYLNRVYIPTSGSATARDMCGPYDTRVSERYLVHDAGQPWSCGVGNDDIARLASMVLACGMVSDSLCDKDSNLPQTAGLDVYEFRLIE